jgi:Tfp pilus assembly protein PilF
VNIGISLPAIAVLVSSLAFGQRAIIGKQKSFSDETVKGMSGRVVLEQGIDPPAAATVKLICHDKVRAQAETDSHGYFSFSLGQGLANAFDTGQQLSSNFDGSAGMAEPLVLQDCEVRAILAGYGSQTIRVNFSGSSFSTDVGLIVLQNPNRTDGATASVADLGAPEKAKKELIQGVKEEQKGNWSAAREKFEKALKSYSKFPSAWLALGRLQRHQSDVAGASNSFQQALAADPRNPIVYRDSASLQASQSEWAAVIETTDRALQLSSSVPQFWYLNSVANFNMKRMAAAETSALRGLSSDPHHTFPEMEYVLGVIRANNQHFAEAAKHLQTYLSFVPQGANQDKIRSQLSYFEDMAAKTKQSEERVQSVSGK